MKPKPSNVLSVWSTNSPGHVSTPEAHTQTTPKRPKSPGSQRSSRPWGSPAAAPRSAPPAWHARSGPPRGSGPGRICFFSFLFFSSFVCLAFLLVRGVCLFLAPVSSVLLFCFVFFWGGRQQEVPCVFVLCFFPGTRPQKTCSTIYLLADLIFLQHPTHNYAHICWSIVPYLGAQQKPTVQICWSIFVYLGTKNDQTCWWMLVASGLPTNNCSNMLVACVASWRPTKKIC